MWRLFDSGYLRLKRLPQCELTQSLNRLSMELEGIMEAVISFIQPNDVSHGADGLQMCKQSPQFKVPDPD